VACAAWWPLGARAAAFIADEAARAIVSSAGLLDVWPWLSWRVPPTSIAWTVVYYAAVTACLWTTLSRRRRIGAAAMASVAGVVIAAGVDPIARAPAPGHLRLTMLDVGQGEAIVLQLPGGRSALVDAGGLGAEFDIGGRVVTPALWALGVRRLDWLLFTHPDGDHIGGALSVTGDLLPREVWEGVPVATNVDRSSLRAAALGRGIAWRALQAGDHLDIGGARLDVVHPPRPDWERPRSRNDDSVVLRVRIDEVEILLTGDAGAEFERLFAAGDPAPIRILKVGHHGSRSSTSQALLAAYRPHVALISAGRGNLFGHPAPEVLARLTAIGTTTFRTDRDGAITIDTDGQSVAIDTWSGRRLAIDARDVGAPEGASRPSAPGGSS
jgi:competence protein ComEC